MRYQRLDNWGGGGSQPWLVQPAACLADWWSEVKWLPHVIATIGEDPGTAKSPFSEERRTFLKLFDSAIVQNLLEEKVKTPLEFSEILSIGCLLEANLAKPASPKSLKSPTVPLPPPSPNVLGLGLLGPGSAKRTQGLCAGKQAWGQHLQGGANNMEAMPDTQFAKWEAWRLIVIKHELEQKDSQAAVRVSISPSETPESVFQDLPLEFGTDIEEQDSDGRALPLGCGDKAIRRRISALNDHNPPPPRGFTMCLRRSINYNGSLWRHKGTQLEPKLHQK